jgi:hypothetical protein
VVTVPTLRNLQRSILTLALAPWLFADVRIADQGRTLRVTSATSAAVFKDAALISLKNLETNEEFVRQPGSVWFEVNMKEPPGEDLKVQSGGWRTGGDPQGRESAQIEYRDETRVALMVVGLDADGEIFLRFQSRSAVPGLRSMFWGIMGVDLTPGRLVIPAQAGTYYDLHSVPSLLGLDYPVHWEAQMVAFEHDKAGFFFYCRDGVPHYKRLLGSRETGTLDFGFEMFAVAPWNASTTTPELEWRLDTFRGDWRTPADRYRKWADTAFRRETADGGRAWVREIRAVITVQNLTPVIVDLLAQRLIPQKTLVYLTDWRKDPYDVNYPDYRWKEQAREFITKARAAGFRIMLHTNTLGVSPNNPDFNTVRDLQMKGADELELLGWEFDLPEGHPRRLAYISPSSSTYRRLYIERIRPMMEELRPDAIHMDAGAAIVNDGNGLIEGMNTAQGLMQFHREILAAFPGVTLAGESTNEILAPYNWFAQRWPSSSPPHPIGTYLYGDQVFFYGFLDQPQPDEPDYTEYLKRYEGQGVQPTPIINHPFDLSNERPGMARLFRMLRLWQENDLQPDWQSEWGADLFRHRNADGRVTAAVETQEHLVSLRIGEEYVYQRIRDANQMETTGFVPNWPAFDEQRIFGLDPARQYWLEADQRPANVPRITGLPEGLRVGANSMVTGNFGYFEIDRLEPPAYDFAAAFFRATKGTMYTGRDYNLINGSLVMLTRMRVGGELRTPVVFMHPPYRRVLGGATFVEYTATVPVAPRVMLNFEVGLADNAPVRTDGILAVLRVDGTELWRQTVDKGAWLPVQIDVSAYAGRTVKVRLITSPGARGDGLYDWAGWAGLAFSTAFTDQPPITVALPEGARLEAFSGQATAALAGDGRNVDVSGLSLPGKFLVFLKPGPLLAGDSLFSAPYTVWRQGYNGLPTPGAYEGSGAVRSAASGGVTRDKAIYAHPPRNGRTHLIWHVTLPADAMELAFGAGLSDGGEEYSGTEFRVVVNGETLYTKEAKTTGWDDQVVDLHRWRGQNVVIQLITDSLKSQILDAAYWTGLEIRRDYRLPQPRLSRR